MVESSNLPPDINPTVRQQGEPARRACATWHWNNLSKRYDTTHLNDALQGGELGELSGSASTATRLHAAGYIKIKPPAPIKQGQLAAQGGESCLKL
ncbi:hypothetical protein FQN49_003341 [Arthroderma sp. PD_2]|nr:hypothetical protein FQN49_003341 [Arthroderma sp. PD_2]